jgi:hypothetical protein
MTRAPLSFTEITEQERRRTSLLSCRTLTKKVKRCKHRKPKEEEKTYQRYWPKREEELLLLWFLLLDSIYAQQIKEEGYWIEEESKLPCSVFCYKNRERKTIKERENGRERDLRIVREFWESFPKN